MKKIAIASIIAIAAAAASAVEVGVNTGRDFGVDRNATGVTVGERFGKAAVTAGFDRSTKGLDNQNRFSVVGSYDFYSLGPVTFDARGGLAYVDNVVARDGFAAVAGVGARYPITNNIFLTSDLTRQFGESKIEQFNSNRFTVGLKYKF